MFYSVLKRVLIIGCFVLPIAIFSQERSTLEIKGITTSLENSEKNRLNDVVINIYESNDLIKTYQSDEKGKFEFEVDMDSYLIIEFAKEGFFSKKILFDAHSSNIDREKNYKPFKFEIIMFEYISGVDYDEMDFPVARIVYSDNKKEFVYSDKYTDQMINEQKKVLKELTKTDKKGS